MTHSDTLRRITLPAALAALLFLAGCGIKGPLELPPDAQSSVAKGGTGKGSIPQAARLPGYKPTAKDLREAKQLGKPERPDEPFVLDPLLK